MAEEIFNTIYENVQDSNIKVLKLKEIYSNNKRDEYYTPNFEYTDYEDLSFDSYIIPTSELKPGELRLLEVDNRVVLPMEITVRILISSEDVLHSWAVPSLGLKTDAIPGRLNQTTLMSTRPGLFYGQCSEICGSNHSFMPIVLELVPLKYFEKWSASIL